MRKTSALVAGILDGMSSPASLFTVVRYPKLAGSDLDRMRSDVKRVGDDFKTVIRRENGKTIKK